MAARDLDRVRGRRSNAEEYRPSSCCALCRARPNPRISETPSHSVGTRRKRRAVVPSECVTRGHVYLETCTAELLVAVLGENVLLDVVVVHATDPALSLVSHVSLTMQEMRLVAE